MATKLCQGQGYRRCAPSVRQACFFLCTAKATNLREVPSQHGAWRENLTPKDSYQAVMFGLF